MKWPCGHIAVRPYKRTMTCKIITVANLKGGVGKTTTAVNLAASLAFAHKKRVIVVDMDPQGNATRALLGAESGTLQYTVKDVMVADPAGRRAFKDILRESGIPGLFVAPSDLALSEAEFKLVSRMGREFILKEALHTTVSSYDYVIIDCPPSLGILTLNALAASHNVIVPCETQFLSLQGLRYVLDLLNLIRVRLNPQLKLLGVLATKFYVLSSANNEALKCLRGLRDVPVFEAVIPRDVRAEEAPSHGCPLVLYAPEARATRQYLRFGDEVIARCRD